MYVVDTRGRFMGRVTTEKGVAALLGFMYNAHPVICKQNRLRCYPFASPCVASREFVEKKIGEDYITSVALSTDLVTRLSLESIKKMNLRLDAIMESDKECTRICMLNCQDVEVDGDDEAKEADKASQLITKLRTLATPNPKGQLFPLGRVLWFIPKDAMDDDDVRRRENLMGLRKGADPDKKHYKTASSDGVASAFSNAFSNIQKGFEEFQQTVDHSILNAGS